MISAKHFLHEMHPNTLLCFQIPVFVSDLPRGPNSSSKIFAISCIHKLPDMVMYRLPCAKQRKQNVSIASNYPISALITLQYSTALQKLKSIDLLFSLLLGLFKPMVNV